MARTPSVPPPPDVLVSGRDEPRWTPPAWLRRWVPPRRAVLALLAVGLAVVAVGRAGRDGDAARPPAAALTVVGDAIAVSQGGVVVVPVALSSPGAALRVRSAEVTAAPVRTASLVTAPDVVPRGGSRRLAVIVDPDCTVIGPEVGGELVATLVVRVVQPSGQEDDLRLALGEAPAVRALLEGLCGGRARVAVASEQERREVGLATRIALARG